MHHKILLQPVISREGQRVPEGSVITHLQPTDDGIWWTGWWVAATGRIWTVAVSSSMVRYGLPRRSSGWRS